MLRKRSRAVSSKQALMSDHSPLPSPSSKCNRPTPSPFPSPRSFVGFSSKGLSDVEPVRSPTSILETKPYSLFSDVNARKPIIDPNTVCKHRPWGSGDSGPVGLGIVDALKDEFDGVERSSKQESKTIIFGSQLKIRVPSLTSVAPTGPMGSPVSPIEFGIKTNISQLGPVFPTGNSSMRTRSLSSETMASPRVFNGPVSASEMELSEDYTCVISHGPNPRTIHIFENCIMECCGDELLPSLRKESLFLDDRPGYPSDKLFSFCHSCKKDLRQGKGIYMCRGEKAFCSRECRNQRVV